ncbi:hypothetical protein ABIF65_008024 [Bradyrhizobium japonicum]|uniref:hypothetical protein n=1 Tax=Bradyrhizobium TaxID=374 RepID=UPI001BABFA9C|nr:MULTISPECIES: hypothetical protein [Bradyrhizobium]WLB98407.1 hypothetical protein QIH92_02360 [Bradyrhizobium japonicum USDA 123]MCP1746018.1 hypothetical protein [Bradyrhizobium japonicum]MCP1773699.1 hypothetical protein [Bradyrhizobium japonicum]MCP1863918.1 hypothetical protein [Bradyrhizobium japonicum]MCP1894505.1 hypothetical protein [Bradyrhizobium japonicum]
MIFLVSAASFNIRQASTGGAAAPCRDCVQMSRSSSMVRTIGIGFGWIGCYRDLTG